MAIELVTYPTSGAPVSTDDYDAQNNLIQAGIYANQNPALILTEWDTLTEPEIADGIYIQHGGALYLVDGDEAISGAPLDGDVFVKISESLGVLTAEFVNSDAGYEWNDIYRGYYHIDGTQIFCIKIVKDGTDYKKYRMDRSNIDIEGDIAMTGDLAISGDTDVSDGNLTINMSITTGSQIVTASGTWTIPKGLYQMTPDNSYLILELYISGSWRGIPGNFNSAFGLVFSDGTNMRIKNNDSSSRSIYYQKLDRILF
jgi:hypothetical protein